MQRSTRCSTSIIESPSSEIIYSSDEDGIDPSVVPASLFAKEAAKVQSLSTKINSFKKENKKLAEELQRREEEIERQKEEIKRQEEEIERQKEEIMVLKNKTDQAQGQKEITVGGEKFKEAFQKILEIHSELTVKRKLFEDDDKDGPLVHEETWKFKEPLTHEEYIIVSSTFYLCGKNLFYPKIFHAI